MEKNILKIVYDAIDSKLGENIEIIDFRNHSPYVDYFIIASSNNERKAMAIVDEIFDRCDKENISYHVNTNARGSKWLICDIGEVVCHIFVNEERDKYNLEGLWRDLPRVKM